MNRKTFTISAPMADIEPSRDGMVCILNNTPKEAGKTLCIRAVRMTQPSPSNADVTNTGGNQGRIGLYRISATSGGGPKPFVKFDTTADDLPSQVVLSAMPDAVTTGDHFRSFGDVSSFGITQTISWQAQDRWPGPSDSRQGLRVKGDAIWWKGGVETDLQYITLAEGEGLAAVQRDFGQPQSHHWAIVIKVAATGKTYRRVLTSCGSPRDLNGPIWSLFNGAGSGVVIEVCIVKMPDFGESNAPRYRLARIDGVRWISGDAVTPITPCLHDTSLNLSGINAYLGPFVAICEGGATGINLDYLNYQATEMTIARQQKAGTFRHFLSSDPWYSLTHTPNLRFRDGDYVLNPTLEGICIPPGKGFAVLAGGNGLVETSEGAYEDIEIIAEFLTPSRSAAPVLVVGMN